MTGTLGDEIRFGPFRLDRGNARLLRDGRAVALTPKAFDVLHFLASRPDRLVTKDELLSAVWPDVIVSDASVKVCVREVRKALDDGAKTPKYIETVHRRGYRFVARVSAGGSDPASPEAAITAVPPAPSRGEPGIAAPDFSLAADLLPVPPAPARPPLVGRDREMRRLGACFNTAVSGRRQCVFLSGGAGTGKTALAETFLNALKSVHRDGANPLVLEGHCFQQFGTSEPYMPVWEAMARLARERKSPALSTLLARHAAAYESADTVATPDKVATPRPPSDLPPRAASEPRAMSERLLRDMADGIEALAAEAPVVLLLEDVQWADYSTLDLLSALARRRSSTRLLVIATYRPAEVQSSDHPLRGVARGLKTGELCEEIELNFLEEPAVGHFLAERFAGGRLPPALARRLHQRTDGHPLFLVHLVDDLVEQGVLAEVGGVWQLSGTAAKGPVDFDGDVTAWLAVLDTHIPQTVRAMIESHLERLSRHERQALEAAAVAGVEFSAAAVAAGLAALSPDGNPTEPADVVHAEQVCDELARRHRFLEPRGTSEWPDGTVATQYRFAHELYHRVVYEQVPAARRVKLHQVIGLRVEAAWRDRAPEEAAGQAMHFEQARDWPRAVAYLRHAARAAARQHAHREAVHYLRRAVSALDRLPQHDRAAHGELDVLKCLGVNLQVTRGFAADEVRQVHDRAYAMCRSAASEPGDVSVAFPVIWGIWLYHKVRSDLRRARDMALELLAMAGSSGDTALLLQAHQAMCVTHLCLGAPDVTCDHTARAVAAYDTARHSANAETYGQDPCVASLAFGAVALWLTGRANEALAASDRSIDLARRLHQPSSLALATHFAAMLAQCRGDIGVAGRWAQETIEVAAEEGFSFWHAGGVVLRGWSRAAVGAPDESAADAAIDEIRRGIEAWLATGSRTYHTYFLGLLADALQRRGRYEEAFAPLTESLSAARSLPEGLYESELHRLLGRCHENAGEACQAEASYARAVLLARSQGAKVFECRAAADLESLLRRSGRDDEADAVARGDLCAAHAGAGR